MISMYTKQEIIIKSYREGKSQRTISKELGISRKTVRKYLNQYESYQKKSIDNPISLANYLSEPIAYDSTTRSKIKLTVEVEEQINQLLEKNRKNKVAGLRKQLLKKKDIHNILQERGIDIGYTTVCNYISSKESKPSNREAFIRQEYQPGEVCEFDWGEIKVYIDGVLTRLQLAVFTSAYSNYRYACIFQRQDTLSFMESHVRFFNHVGVVFNQMVYDNMRVAVSKFVGLHEKEPTSALLRLRGHYQFSHRFCNVYRGNEKGHVERSVEYIRRKAFSFKNDFESLSHAEQWLATKLENINSTTQQLTGTTAKELFLSEQQQMQQSPPDLICFDQEQLRVDKYSTVTYRTNRYSVPDYLVGQIIDIRVLSTQIQVCSKNMLLANHDRDYGKHQWIINIEHYLPTFNKKPGALGGSVALSRSSYLRRLYTEYYQQTPKSFIDLLIYCNEHRISGERLESAVQRLLKSCPKNIGTEQIKVLLGNKEDQNKSTCCNESTALAKEQLKQTMALLT